MLLEFTIEQAKPKKRNHTIFWLDLANAKGSLPQDFLSQLFSSLSIPNALRNILMDIYSDNIFQFVVGSKLVSIRLTSGVRQGDGLSSIIFNLATEPLLRCAKGPENAGFSLFGKFFKATAYVDDILLVGSCTEDLQPTVDAVLVVAADLGLRFNAGKGSSLIISKGKANPAASLHIRGVEIWSLS
jgi:hypothetical protein